MRKAATNNFVDSQESAEEAGLRYITDSAKGISRIRNGKGFVYKSNEGKKITDVKTLDRIKSLVIPPAWEKVWISPSPNSHLQATGFDSRKRKQYKYHPDWIELRNIDKYERLYSFGNNLPLIRKANAKNLKLKGMPKEKALAIIVSLLDKVFIRIGNREYEKSNNSYGLTTLRDKHVKIGRDKIEFKFKAKSGKESYITLKDKLLCKLVKQCREIPGYHLFQYYDDNGNHIEIHSQDVNTYLKEITGENFTSKDFRTWAGTVNAYDILKDRKDVVSQGEKKKALVECVKEVAKKLNNTVAICKKYYIHPAISEAFESGAIFKIKKEKKFNGFEPYECDVLSILKKDLRNGKVS